MNMPLIDVERRTLPGWLRTTLDKVAALKHLEANWDSHGGRPLLPDVQEEAIRLVSNLGIEELPVPGVVLCSPGSVQFEWQVRGRELEIEVLPGGGLGFLKVHTDGRMEEGQAEGDTLAVIRELLGWVVNG